MAGTAGRVHKVIPVVPQAKAADGSRPSLLSFQRVALGSALLAARGVRRSARASDARRRAEGSTSTAVKVREEDPVALEKEAAKLRSEVADLEAQQEEARRRERQALFQVLDSNSDGELDARELQKGVKQVMGADVDDETAERLVKALDVNGDGKIQPEELDFNTVQRLLQEFRREMQSKEEAERTAAYASKEKDMLRREWDQFLANRPPRNDDMGLLTRLGSAASYLLPLTDALRFGMFLFAALPAIQPLLNLLVVPVLLVNALPFGLGYLALFFGMQTLAANKELPALLRYNLRQAITLDVALVFMGLLGGVIQTVAGLAGSPIPIEISGGISTGIYLLVSACCVYSMATSLSGNYPKGLGPLSEIAEFQIFDTAPRDGEEDTSKFFKFFDETNRDNEK